MSLSSIFEGSRASSSPIFFFLWEVCLSHFIYSLSLLTFECVLITVVFLLLTVIFSKLSMVLTFDVYIKHDPFRKSCFVEISAFCYSICLFCVSVHTKEVTLFYLHFLKDILPEFLLSFSIMIQRWKFFTDPAIRDATLTELCAFSSVSVAIMSRTPALKRRNTAFFASTGCTHAR